MTTDLAPVAVNLVGFAEHPQLGDSPYRVSRDGEPYVPAGDGGIVLGLRLGDPVSALAADHAAPGACLVHPEPAARLALATYACIGNRVEVRTGPAAGAAGAVAGKRGEAGRVITVFAPGDLARLRPGDAVAVRACGQGWRPPGFPAPVAVMNIDPGLLAALPVQVSGDQVTAGVRLSVPSQQAGNGIGRPAAGWDLDLQLDDTAAAGLRLGDLVAVTGLDARWNMGYRRDWVTIGVTVHGGSPLPGHGPGITPILTGPAAALHAEPGGTEHAGLTEAALKLQ